MCIKVSGEGEVSLHFLRLEICCPGVDILREVVEKCRDVERPKVGVEELPISRW